MELLFDVSIIVLYCAGLSRFTWLEPVEDTDGAAYYNNGKFVKMIKAQL